jgi:hypothetical protein
MGLADWFGPPKKIDPAHIQSMMTSEYTTQMGDRAQQMADPNSQLMQGMYQNMQKQGQDQLYAQNRMARAGAMRQNMGGQSGIMEAQRQQRVGQQGNQNVQNFAGMQQSMLGQSNQVLGGAAQHDMTARGAAASAYGQNITNENNYNSGMAGMVTQLAGGAMMAMCDPRTKTGMRKVGIIKTSKDPINLYSFSYKGSGGKRSVGLSSTNVKKQFKSFVQKDKKGLEWINMTRLKDVLR